MDMYTRTLCGTFSPYECHVFLCYKDLHDRLSFGSRLVRKRVAEAIKDLNNATAVEVVVADLCWLTICNGGDGTGLSSGILDRYPDYS
ncbi:hypothetical protein LXL04_007025 [Taraxacum kok-saghyz]